MFGADRVLSAPAARNKHIKKKSYSRTASSAATSSSPEKEKDKEARPPVFTGAPSTPASEVEVSQQSRIMRVFQIEHSFNRDTQSERPFWYLQEGEADLQTLELGEEGTTYIELTGHARGRLIYAGVDMPETQDEETNGHVLGEVNESTQ